MHIIGIAGGGTVWGLGTVQEIQLFFDCIEVDYTELIMFLFYF